MPKKDLSQLAKSIVDQATGDAPIVQTNARAKAGKLGGLKGGKSRMSALTAEEKTQLAIKGATARWPKKVPDATSGTTKGALIKKR